MHDPLERVAGHEEEHLPAGPRIGPAARGWPARVREMAGRGGESGTSKNIPVPVACWVSNPSPVTEVTSGAAPLSRLRGRGRAPYNQIKRYA
jgi:hypothetical protein